MKKQTGTLDWRIIMCVFVGGCMAASLMLYYVSNLCELAYQMVLAPAAFLLMGLVLFQTDAMKNLPGRILWGAFLCFFLSLLTNEKVYGSLLENRGYFYSLVIQLFVCFPLWAALSGTQREKALNWLMRLSLFLVAAACAIGVYAACTNQYFEPWVNMDYGIGIFVKPNGDGSLHRLTILCHANSVGLIGSVGLLLGVWMLLTRRSLFEKLLTGIACLLIYVAVALSVSRTSMLAVSGGMALFAFRFAFLRLQRKKPLLRIGGALAAGLVLLVLTYGLFSPAVSLVTKVAVSTSAPASAPAQSAEVTPSPEQVQPADSAALIEERPLTADVVAFSGRPFIWKQAVSTFGSNPRLWLFGHSPSEVGNQVSPSLLIWTTQMHSSFVQILIASGLPCLLLFLAFLVVLGRRCIRLYFGGGTGSTDLGYLPAILVPIVVFALMESFLVIYPQLYFANLWFFLLAGAACTEGAK